MTLSSVWAQATTAIQAPPMIWGKSSFGLSSSSQYFTSNANYDHLRGSFERLSGDNSFTSFESRLKARYGFSQRLSVFGGFGFAHVRAVDSVNEKTNSALTDAFAGLDFLLWTKWVRIIPELQIGFPITGTERGQTVPMTSDGVAYIDAGVFLFKPFRHFRLGGYAGAHLPDDGLAKRFTYEVFTEVPVGEMIVLGGGLNGYETVAEDELTYSQRSATSTSANAGSQRFYAYDPSLMEARFWLGLKADSSLMVRVGYGKTLDGVRTAEGQSFLVSLDFNTRGIRARANDPRERAREKSRQRQEEAMKTFEVAPEETDPDLFEADDFSEEAPPPPPKSDSDALDDTEKMLENL